MDQQSKPCGGQDFYYILLKKGTHILILPTLKEFILRSSLKMYKDMCIIMFTTAFVYHNKRIQNKLPSSTRFLSDETSLR